MSDENSTTFSPPYNISWSTFINTLERVAEESPTKIDRSYLNSTAGTVQTYLIAAFRNFGLITEDQTPTEALKQFSLLGKDDRPGFIGRLLRTHYALAVECGQRNSTPGELENAFTTAFPTVTGESRRKAIRFFLAAADYAGVPKSPLWKLPKASPSGPRKPGSRTKRNPSTEPKPPAPAPSSDMKQKYFDLLLKKAESTETVDTDLLDRIERLVGLTTPAAKREEHTS